MMADPERNMSSTFALHHRRVRIRRQLQPAGLREPDVGSTPEKVLLERTTDVSGSRQLAARGLRLPEPTGLGRRPTPLDVDARMREASQHRRYD